MRVHLAVAAAFVAVALAGCVSDGEEDHFADGHTHDEPAPAGTVRLEAYDCEQAGGNSVYGMEEGETKVGPWLAADQRPEVGDPTIGAYGEVLTGPANGIWHVATRCETYVYNGQEYADFGMGWIAQMIQRPDVDQWGEPRLHFFVADLSFSDTGFVEDLKEAALGAEISPALETTIEWVAPESYMRVILSEANHGTFDFSAEIHKEFAQKQDEHLRFWMLPRADGQAVDHDHLDGAASQAPVLYRPIAIDVHDTLRGPPTPKLAGESAGTFTHFPDGHVGNPLGHYQYGFDRVIEIGPIPQNVTYEETWLH